MVDKKKARLKTLAAGRPPTTQHHKVMSRKATKSLINRIHLLEKRKQQALSRQDRVEVSVIESEIASLGGLERYQEASLQGQAQNRGGDSSRVLMQWLRPHLNSLNASGTSLRMLEVGALSKENACSMSGLFEMVRIDLNSQGEGILQQDFMERPLPKEDSEKFDIISLSLVLNFVPEPQRRGDMLVRTLDFLKEPGRYRHPSTPSAYFPSLFMVLPAPCVTNSRYLNEERLEAIMTSLKYAVVARKTTQHLVYYLWKRQAGRLETEVTFLKREVRAGSSRNNFAVVMNPPI